MKRKKTVFITGFPGFIAHRLVDQLNGPDVNFFLLVQQQFVDTAARSVEAIAEKANTTAENFALIEGDITKPGLGMSEDDLDTVRSETTDIFHLAAVYDLAVEKRVAFAVNLEGTKNVNDLALSITRLDRYSYVSTCYVAGRREGVIFETELEHDAGFRNHYEETKYLAEIEVQKLKDTLPVTIFRPSVVVGDSHTGETAKYDGIYYLILYLLKAPKLLRLVNVGNREVKLNLVPVDFVVKGIADLSAAASAVGKTIALADPEPLATSELFNAISEELCGKKSLFTPPAFIVERSLMLPFSPAITGLPHAGVPYFFLAQTYDTSIAKELLESHGIRCPNFRDYVPNLLSFVRDNPSLRAH